MKAIIIGTIEQSLGKRLQGKQVESVLRGGSHDIFEFVAIPTQSLPANFQQ
jgi:hypothetical protein